MAIKYINISNLRPSKIYPNLDFWFGNKPSGNPAIEIRQKRELKPISSRGFASTDPRKKVFRDTDF
jgi:hypothetical protein